MFIIELMLLAGTIAVLLVFVNNGLKTEECDRRQAYWARYEVRQSQVRKDGAS